MFRWEKEVVIMPAGEIILLGTMGITAVVSTLFTLYMLKQTIWSEPVVSKVSAVEAHKASC